VTYPPAEALIDRLRPRITHLNVKYELTAEPDCRSAATLRTGTGIQQPITNALQAMGEKGGTFSQSPTSAT
jgi:hypothetical protein